jgi:hypothetical protein
MTTFLDEYQRFLASARRSTPSLVHLTTSGLGAAHQYQFFDMVLTRTENVQPSTLRWARGTVARVVRMQRTSSGQVRYEIEWQTAEYQGFMSAWVTSEDIQPHSDAHGSAAAPPGQEAAYRMQSFLTQ